MKRASILACLTSAACGDAVFHCIDDQSCNDGLCEPSGYCSFEDPECASGRRYGDRAGEGLANECVPPEQADGSSGGSTIGTVTTADDASGSGSTSNVATGVDPTTTTMPADSDVGPSTSDAETTFDPTTPVDSTTTGSFVEVTVSFGDRDDADFQGVTRDATLDEGARNENLGAHRHLHVSNLGVQTEVGLLRFDVSSLPPGVTVTAAELHLWSDNMIDPGPIDLFVLEEDWVEGDGNHAIGVCNWDFRAEGFPWTTPGAGLGSHAPGAVATLVLDVLATEHVVELPPATIEAWIDDPESNFGLVFWAADGADQTYFLSREEDNALLRPLLVVTYLQ